MGWPFLRPDAAFSLRVKPQPGQQATRGLIQVNEGTGLLPKDAGDASLKNSVRMPPDHALHALGELTMLMTGRLRARCFLYVVSVVAFFVVSTAHAETPAQILEGYSAQAGTVPAPSRGQQFFTTRHEHDWACATCHGAMPTGNGQHAATGKTIGPLAPAFNPERFTNAAKTEKWFRRNCSDVVGRECTPLEKADVLSWLMTLKP